MAVNSFDEVLANVQEPEWKEVFQKATEKYPDLKAGWMRQDDYSKKSNERDSKVKLAEKWEDWRKGNWDDAVGMTKAESELQKRLQVIELEAETLRQSREHEMTFEEVQKEIQKEMENRSKGFLTEDKFKQTYGNKLFDKESYDKNIDERLGRVVAGLENLYVGTYQLGFKHQKEFGEILDPLTVVDYANKNGMNDLTKAYDLMVHGRREETRNKEIETKIAEAKKQGAEEVRKEINMGPGGKMPSDSGSPNMTHLQERILRGNRIETDDKTKIPDEVKMDGSGRLGHHVAEQYRRDAANAQNV